jgi:hypothetical protein
MQVPGHQLRPMDALRLNVTEVRLLRKLCRVIMTNTSARLDLDGMALIHMVEKRVTCPFLGPAVATGALPVRNDVDRPLASLEDVRRLGNAGGGDLGDLLVLFAAGNHAFMRGPTNQLDVRVPNDLFSLELPGSQGSHPGHSGILQGDPEQLASGRFGEANFARLAARARDGLLKRSDVGGFIAENLHRDPRAKVFEANVAKLLLIDAASTLASAGSAAIKTLFGSDSKMNGAQRDLKEKITKLMGEDNLVGSAGEFGLLFAFLAKSPRSTDSDELAVSVDDVRSMFVEKRLPNGWENWEKTQWDWLRHTTGLLVSAAAAYHDLKAKHS